MDRKRWRREGVVLLAGIALLLLALALLYGLGRVFLL
jgi:hypothetical protein